MSDLAVTSGKMEILTVYHAHKIICIDIIETIYPVCLKMKVGIRQAAHAGASSIILTAYLPEEDVMAIINEKGLPKLCTNTITDVDALKNELTKIQEQGYAASQEETDVEAWGVATPIHDWKGGIVGAIGLVGSTLRNNKDNVKQYAALCREYADRIATSLSAREQPTKFIED